MNTPPSFKELQDCILGSAASGGLLPFGAHRGSADGDECVLEWDSPLLSIVAHRDGTYEIRCARAGVLEPESKVGQRLRAFFGSMPELAARYPASAAFGLVSELRGLASVRCDERGRCLNLPPFCQPHVEYKQAAAATLLFVLRWCRAKGVDPAACEGSLIKIHSFGASSVTLGGRLRGARGLARQLSNVFSRAGVFEVFWLQRDCTRYTHWLLRLPVLSWEQERELEEAAGPLGLPAVAHLSMNQGSAGWRRQYFPHVPEDEPLPYEVLAHSVWKVLTPQLRLQKESDRVRLWHRSAWLGPIEVADVCADGNYVLYLRGSAWTEEVICELLGGRLTGVEYRPTTPYLSLSHALEDGVPIYREGDAWRSLQSPRLWSATYSQAEVERAILQLFHKWMVDVGLQQVTLCGTVQDTASWLDIVGEDSDRLYAELKTLEPDLIQLLRRLGVEEALQKQPRQWLSFQARLDASSAHGRLLLEDYFRTGGVCNADVENRRGVLAAF